MTTAGASVANVAVSLVDATGAVLGRATSDASGFFVASAPVGTAYARTEPKAGYVAQAFDRKTCVGGTCDLATATPLAVQLGQIRAGVNFALTACSPFSIRPVVLPASTVSHTYSATLTGSGGSAPYRYSIVRGDIPPGLTLAATTGALAGTITQAGSYRFTVGAADALGCGAQLNYRLEVKGCPVSLSAEYMLVSERFRSARGPGVRRVPMARQHK